MGTRKSFAGNTTSQYDSGLIVKEVHDYYGQALRTIDTRSVIDGYSTYFRATYNVDNKPTEVQYYRGIRAHKTEIVCVDAVGLSGKSFVIHSCPSNTPYKVWFNVDSTGVAPSGTNLIEIPLNSTDTSDFVALAIDLTLRSLYGKHFNSSRYGNKVEVLTLGLGEVDNSYDVDSGVTVVNSPGQQEQVSEITISYSGVDPIYNGQVLRGYEFDLYSGKFLKTPEVSVQSSEVVQTPSIQNVTLPLANTEYELVFPTGTKKFLIKTRNNGNLKASWSVGESTVTYLSIGAGVNYSEDGLNLTETNRTLYITTDTPGLIVELLSWV